MADFTAPFRVIGPAFSILGSFAVSPPGTLVNLNGDWSALVFNRSATIDAYLAYGPTSASVSGAIVPIVSSPATPTQGVLPIPFRTVQTFTFSGPTFLGAVVPSGNATIDITPGSGN